MKETQNGKAGSLASITNSKAQLSGSVEDGLVYEPWRHRDPKVALGTCGALFHMVKGSLGSGILSMPVAFKNGGLWVSLGGAIFVGLVCTYCVHILVHCSQYLSVRVRAASLGYAATAEAAILTGPPRIRKYSGFIREFVDISLVFTYYFGCTVYVVFIGSTLQQVVEANLDVHYNPRVYVLLSAVVVVPVGSIRQLRYLVPFSFMAILFLLFGCGFVLYDVFQDLPPLDSRPAFTSFSRLPLFYATVLFALEGIGTVFPIENVMKKPKHFLGCPGVLNVAMGLLIVLYALVGFFGYLRYGEETQGSVTLNLAASGLGEVVKVLTALNVLFSYGLCFTVPSEILWGKLQPRVRKEHYTRAYYTMRVLLICSSVLIGCALPDLEPFVGLTGAVFYSTLGLLFPALIDLVTFWDDVGPVRLLRDGFLVVMWLVALTAGTQASIAKIFETFH